MSNEKKTDRRKPGGPEPLEQTKKLDSAAVNAVNETADNGGCREAGIRAVSAEYTCAQTQPVRRQDEQGQKKAK